ncbi:AAA family ATPase [Allomuricauda taeanensis]|nr:AAA family ATPase [Allomuricauda taeanensis]
MYINSISISNFRVFKKTGVRFVHPNQRFTKKNFPKPELPNVNCVLGTNGLGKTSFLKTIALSCLGPAVGDAGIFPYSLIRKDSDNPYDNETKSEIQAHFLPHEQDHIDDFDRLESKIEIHRRSDTELLRWSHDQDKAWHPIYDNSSESFFFVGYGANRRVEKQENIDFGSRSLNSMYRAQRIKSLFEETYSLVPLNSWLGQYRTENPGRYTQIRNLINIVLEGRSHFSGEQDDNGEFLFSFGKMKIPFPALSDGYRAFIGWLGDFLYHVNKTCPSGKKLVENKGIVLVDEIDLHIHPEWQKTLLTSIAKAFPNIQFIVTTHSPLIVGSLEWMNIIMLTAGSDNSSKAKKIKTDLKGLDADQILLTPLFKLKSSRVDDKSRTINILSDAATKGDIDAAKEFLNQLF